jgi:hypothetical protein
MIVGTLVSWCVEPDARYSVSPVFLIKGARHVDAWSNPGLSAALAESKLLHQVSCTVARFYVAKYSEAAAETWARGKCATETEIEAARICLKGVSVRTAQSTQ